MRKIISSILTVIILSTMFVVGFPASAKATTLNGKAVSKGQIVTVTYRIKAPKLMEDIQAHVDYTGGLKLMSVSYSSEMKKGSFIENHKLTRQIRFNAVCIMKPMNFKKTTNLISMKFKITGKGSMKTSLNLICLDATDGTNYGRTGANSQYRKLNISTVTKRLASSVKLNRNTLALKRNKTYKFKATVSPATTDNKSVKWSVSNRKVLKISNGKVKAVRKGTSYVYCKTTDGSNKTAKCKVVVR